MLHPPVSSLCKPLSLLQLDLGCLTTRLSFSQVSLSALSMLLSVSLRSMGTCHLGGSS